eukprot:g8784.t1
MQALLSYERTEHFKCLFHVFRELHEGAQPEVICTDGDQAAMTAIDKECPDSTQPLCLFHMDENLGKHGKGLGPGILMVTKGAFDAAAYAQTEEMFLRHKTDVFKKLTPGSHMNKYVKETIFDPRRVQRWASFEQPGLHTLNIHSTQRVESTNSVLKTAMERSGTMVDVHNAIVGEVMDDITKSERQTAGGAVDRVRQRIASSAERMRDGWLEGFGFVREGMRHAKCCAFAMKDATTEALAAMGYKVDILARGKDNVELELVNMASNPASAGLFFDPTSGGGDGTAFRGIREMEFGFNSGCIAPRWRYAEMPWTLAPLAAKRTVPSNTEGDDARTVPSGGRKRGSGRVRGGHGARAGGMSSTGRGRGEASLPGGSAAGMPSLAVVVPTYQQAAGAGTTNRGGDEGAPGPRVSPAGMSSLAGGVPAFQPAAGTGTISGGGDGAGPGLGLSAASTLRPGVHLSARRACGTGTAVGVGPAITNGTPPMGGLGAPLRSLGNAPRGGVGQVWLGLAATAFAATNSCAPESFQQSRLNGERLRAGEDHGQPPPSTDQDVAFLDQVHSPPTKRQTGKTKRRTSTAKIDTRGGGQNAIRGGAGGAWGS